MSDTDRMTQLLNARHPCVTMLTYEETEALGVVRAAAGKIGLIAVKGEARGAGVGSALLRAALDWLVSNRVASFTVATQLRNVRALRFYGRAGLLISSVELWFHLWPSDLHV